MRKILPFLAAAYYSLAPIVFAADAARTHNAYDYVRQNGMTKQGLISHLKNDVTDPKISGAYASLIALSALLGAADFKVHLLSPPNSEMPRALVAYEKGPDRYFILVEGTIRNNGSVEATVLQELASPSRSLDGKIDEISCIKIGPGGKGLSFTIGMQDSDGAFQRDYDAAVISVTKPVKPRTKK